MGRVEEKAKRISCTLPQHIMIWYSEESSSYFQDALSQNMLPNNVLQTKQHQGSLSGDSDNTMFQIVEEF